MVEPMFKMIYASQPKVGEFLTLGGSEGKHAVAVRRVRQGESIQFSNGSGLRVRAIVETLQQGSLTAKIVEVIQEDEPTVRLTLIQALAKGDRDELAVQAATELGCYAVVPWQAERSISRWEGPKVNKGVERWQTIVAEAAKQALRAYEPKVEQPLSSAALASKISDYDRVLVLDPTAAEGLGEISQLPGSVAIIVGPEGGISEAELKLFEAVGASRVHLGKSILRTSTAGVAAISVLQAKLGLWG